MNGFGKPFRVADLPDALRRQICQESARPRPRPGEPAPGKVRKPKAPVNPAHWHGKEVGREGFQRHVERWLWAIGFNARTKQSIELTQGKGGRLGWQIHCVRAIGNPYLLDVLLLGHDGRHLEFELKTATGELSPTQALLVAGHPERVCRSLDEVMALVNGWIQEGRRET